MPGEFRLRQRLLPHDDELLRNLRRDDVAGRVVLIVGKP